MNAPNVTLNMCWSQVVGLNLAIFVTALYLETHVQPVQQDTTISMQDAQHVQVKLQIVQLVT